MFPRLHGNVRRPNTGPSNRLPIGQELLKAELHLPLQFCCVAVLVVVSHLFISLTDPGVWGLDLSPSMGSRRKRAQRAACAYRLQPNRWHSSLMTKSLLGVPALRPSISLSTILGVSPSDPPSANQHHIWGYLPFQPHARVCVAFTLTFVYARRSRRGGGGGGRLS